MTVRLNGRADLHIHTTASDGTGTVQETLDHIARMGTLDVIAITDHDRLDASLWAYQHRHRYPFAIVPGVEVTSADGHVLALWVSAPIPTGLSLQETAHAIHEQDGIAVLAHPFEPLIAPHTILRYLTRPQVLSESGIDAVEVHNAGAFTPGGNWLARRVYERTGLPVLGSSDAHMPSLIGTGVTRFQGRTAADLRASIRAGQTAAEGTRWAITDYWKIYRASRRNRLSIYSEMNTSSAPLTRP